MSATPEETLRRYVCTDSMSVQGPISGALVQPVSLHAALAALSLLVAERDEWHETADNRYDAEVLRAVEGELADCREALRRIVEALAPLDDADPIYVDEALTSARAALGSS